MTQPADGAVDEAPLVDRLELEAHAERIRLAGALGRADPVKRLFDYLLERSLTGQAPKGIEVSEAVFGRRYDDRTQDSTTRVYIHRLRQKLDGYYAGAGKSETHRFILPKGGYRLTLVKVEASTEASTPGAMANATPSSTLARLKLPRRDLLAGLGALAALGAATAIGWPLALSRAGFGAVRRNPAWSGLFDNGRPITVVIGDYYIFGELDSHFNVERLVREYDVNSPNDLANKQMDDPVLVGQYANLDLYYLPESIAAALRNLMPVLATRPSERDRIRVVTTSALTPDMLKTTNIVYVGYLSGLGLLREPVFAGSRFRVGETYDQLVDQRSGRTYASQQGGRQGANAARVDYGYVSTFSGPSGNQVLVIAGARDVGLVQMSEVLTTPEGLKSIKGKAAKTRDFEALYEVEALSRVNLRERLIVLAPLQKEKIWETGVRYPMR